MSISSCKKDFVSDDLTELEEIISAGEELIPQFYYRGIIEDLVNNVEVPFNRETSISGIVNNSFVGSASGQGTQSNNGFKFANSGIGTSANNQESFSGPNSESIVELLLGNSINIKIVTELAGDEFNTRFSKEELLSFLIEGKSLSFGSNPGQVEVGFAHPNIEGFPTFSIRQYYGLSINALDISNDTFEILKVEEFEGTMSLEQGLIVTAKINCALGSYEGGIMKLKDVEARFLFLHS